MKHLPSQSPRERIQSVFGEDVTIEPAYGGHMAYHRFIVHQQGGDYFVKLHDPALFPNDQTSRDALHDIQKEAAMYEHLRAHDYPHIPKHVELREDMLILSALTARDGWHWDIPDSPELAAQYTEDITRILGELALVPVHPTFQNIHRAAEQHFLELGTKPLFTDPELRQRIVQRATDKLHLQKPHLTVAHQALIKNIHSLPDTYDDIRHEVEVPRLTLAHHDARISNLAWHPELGARIVDLSWMDPGMPNADATMFAIDLHKAGQKVNAHHPFNPHYARLQMHYWLAKSTHPAGPNSLVRDHQLFSAVAAYDLLQRFGEGQD